jgi:LmbE family N-acetylglucosaminyl deacetylase
MPPDQTLMAVFAHPDDEAFGVGGTLAKYGHQGYQVQIVTATRGEAGQIAEPGLATPANLPLVREQELRCACEVYGVRPPLFLDYQDGQLPVVHQGQAVGRLVRLIREIRPDVLLTAGPHGTYGHYDHIAVHRWTTIAFDLAADPDCFPDQTDSACRPHQPLKLYYHVLSEEPVRAMSRGDRPPAVMMDGVPFAFVGWPDEDITTVIDVSEYAQLKINGIRCHASQVGRDSRYTSPSPELLDSPWLRRETFILARSFVGFPEETEDDLFARLE